MPLTVGLVGAGGMGREHLRQLITLGARVLVWSRSKAGAGALVAEFGGAAVDSFDELLDAAGVIDITTPTPTHLELGRAALDAGRHLICEKPLARTVDDARALADAARDAGRLLLPAHVVRWFPAYARAKDEVDAGALGSLQRLRFFRGGAYPASPWFGDAAQSGGVVMDLMIHDLDQARWLAGEVARVEATRETGEVAGNPVESASVTLTHASGAISTVDGSWGAPDARFATEFEVVGTAGARTYSSRAETPGADVAESPYLAQLRDFLAAVEGDADGDARGPVPAAGAAVVGVGVRVTPEDAVAAVGLATAALESIETGRAVELG